MIFAWVFTGGPRFDSHAAQGIVGWTCYNRIDIVILQVGIL